MNEKRREDEDLHESESVIGFYCYC